MRTIRYGNAEVRLIERDWDVADRANYRMTYRLTPGEHWRDAPESDGQFEYYVNLDGEVMPVGVAIARELLAEGADWACFTELWGKFVIVGADLICQPLAGPVGELIDQLRAANGDRLGGLPDVLAGFPDGQIAMREAKTPRSADRLRANQHRFADVARMVLGDRLDLAVVEWGPLTSPG
ncbi:MAG: hypothetical protein F2681_15010 [Actinobacteria bacterium]|uniref:Unannotated protein n=1 Tax=freshwater metagenome TaxID=449393 RepID=A0A6J6AB53_9ZZZZ|nr:hypothetical protein [Actinomycetota bacterium]MSW78875.1 hypothetical protein [Actinomycetota bacterium]MSX93943.1 hypothetical protein [Actinomycetota bacterium]MSZ84443.1 hypothetical protein [Actinomycetota bacterium]MTB19443.1 hypothetical protein [Actinomycetota bacterium]